MGATTDEVPTLLEDPAVFVMDAVLCDEPEETIQEELETLDEARPEEVLWTATGVELDEPEVGTTELPELLLDTEEVFTAELEDGEPEGHKVTVTVTVVGAAELPGHRVQEAGRAVEIEVDDVEDVLTAAEELSFAQGVEVTPMLLSQSRPTRLRTSCDALFRPAGEA